MNKRRFLLLLAVAALLCGGVATAMLKKPRPTVPTVAPAQPEVLEFLPTDVMRLRPGEVRRLLPLSGSLRAVNQATVKARVAGEVRDVLVREGEAVQAGQVLIRMDTTDYDARVGQAKGALEAARGQLAIATKARDNNAALLDKGFISKNAFDNAASQYDIARANVESAQAALDLARKALADTVIRAPISGQVSSRSVQPGEKVSADNRLLDVVDLSQLELEASVPAADIMNVALGQEVRVRVEGLQASLAGKVVRINPSTIAGSRSIMLYVQVDNPQGLLRAGMFGEAQLTLAKKADVLTVPQAAIQTDAGSSFVYTIEDGKLAKRPVELGLKGNDDQGPAVEIVRGLENDAQIVRANLGTLRPGTIVRFPPIAGPQAAAGEQVR